MNMHKTAKPMSQQSGSTLDFEQQIRNRAYQLYEQRGREEGHDVEDWLRAEAEIRQENTRAAAA